MLGIPVKTSMGIRTTAIRRPTMSLIRNGAASSSTAMAAPSAPPRDAAFAIR
jgi:hypothetical protein